MQDAFTPISRTTARNTNRAIKRATGLLPPRPTKAQRKRRALAAKLGPSAYVLPPVWTPAKRRTPDHERPSNVTRQTVAMNPVAPVAAPHLERPFRLITAPTMPLSTLTTPAPKPLPRGPKRSARKNGAPFYGTHGAPSGHECARTAP